MGWGINFIDAEKLSIPKVKLGSETSWDDFFNPNGKESTSDEPPDLPQNLAFLDVEALLPRLSSVNSGGIELVSLGFLVEAVLI